ncbi:MAG: AAA family ATPase, partial [Desulfatitalea sp.]|nr:ATP-binding protein [Desulfatitalea sp.]NNJ98808.1 AAA family ATPase [Desulfatitalea sp.]
MLFSGMAKIDIDELLTPPEVFPTEKARRRFLRLVGIKKIADNLIEDIHMFFHSNCIEGWCQKHYNESLPIIELMEDMVPLFLFEGDVGTGKTALAETIGDALGRAKDYRVTMIKMSTQVRGTGYVGQMGSMLSAAFKHTVSVWQRFGNPVILIIDEADSLLTSRATQEQHHEDKSGVNTILQHLDAIKNDSSKVAVIAITNRVGVIDPALMRRAASIIHFSRPESRQRKQIIGHLFKGTQWGEDTFN